MYSDKILPGSFFSGSVSNHFNKPPGHEDTKKSVL